MTKCVPCLQRKKPRQPPRPYLAEAATGPWDMVAMDFYGPLVRSEGGNRYVLVFVDHFTKWVELVTMADQLATTVVRAFHDNVICRHGCPTKLLSDNAPNFRSTGVQALCDAFSIKKVFSTAYYPQGDGSRSAS